MLPIWLFNCYTYWHSPHTIKIKICWTLYFKSFSFHLIFKLQCIIDQNEMFRHHDIFILDWISHILSLALKDNSKVIHNCYNNCGKKRQKSGIGSVMTFSIPLDISFADFLISKTSLSAGWLKNSEDGEKKTLKLPTQHLHHWRHCSSLSKQDARKMYKTRNRLRAKLPVAN